MIVVREKFYKLMENLPQARTAQPALVAAAAQEFPLTEWPLHEVKAEEWKFRPSDRTTWTALVQSGEFAKAMVAGQHYFETGVQQQGQAQLLCLDGGLCARYYEEILSYPGVRRLLEDAQQQGQAHQQGQAEQENM